MTEKIYRITCPAPATANKTKSVQFQTNEEDSEMFRIGSIRFQAKNMDALDSNDEINIQLATKKYDEQDEVYDLDSEYEVFTFSLIVAAFGTAANDILIQNPEISYTIPTEYTDGILLKNNKDYFFVCQATGQDAADVEFHLAVKGHGVSTKIDDWQNNNFD